MLKFLMSHCGFFSTESEHTAPSMNYSMIDFIYNSENKSRLYLAETIKQDRSSGLGSALNAYGEIPIENMLFTVLFYCIMNYDSNRPSEWTIYSTIETTTKADLLNHLAMEAIKRIETEAGYPNKEDYIIDLTRLSEKANKLQRVFSIEALGHLNKACLDKIEEINRPLLYAPA